MSNSEAEKSVRVRWKAKGALKTNFYQNGNLIPQEFRPSDEYETTITNTTIFKVLADYGNGETAEQQTQAVISTNGSRAKELTGKYNPSGNDNGSTGTIFDFQPPIIELDGTVNKVFTGLIDLCGDRKVREIESLQISVSQLMDYRKLGTAIPLLNRFSLQIDQTVTIQTGEQFVRLEYQGQLKGFQSFFSTINSLLNSPEAQANVNLKITFEFKQPILPQGTELNVIKQALDRNPVERISLTAKVKY